MTPVVTQTEIPRFPSTTRSKVSNTHRVIPRKVSRFALDVSLTAQRKRRPKVEFHSRVSAQALLALVLCKFPGDPPSMCDRVHGAQSDRRVTHLLRSASNLQTRR
jgi:hypothetical protein